MQSDDGAGRSGSNEEAIGHVSEEAAQTAEIMGETPVDIEEHGTSISEVNLLFTLNLNNLFLTTKANITRKNRS